MIPCRFRLPGMTVLLVALAACSGGPRPASPAPPRATVAPAEIDAAFDLLMAGKEGDARKLIGRLLKRDPQSASARLLSDSIRLDPQMLLGPTSQPYTVRPGNTLVTLSQRFLGNRLKAYQLLRYNGLKAPVLLTPGQTLSIPGEPPRPEPVRRPDAPPTPMRPAAVPATPGPSRGKPAQVRPSPAAAAHDPAAARSARAAGLAALNGGDVGRAVGLLRRAAALDPGNPAIGRDLTRAERIAATVRARR